MLNALTKSFNITKNNPVVVLFLASYFMISVLLTPLLSNVQGIPFYFAISLVVLFNCALFAGWFGMIKKAVLNSEKKYENEDDFYNDLNINNINYSIFQWNINKIKDFLELNE